MFLCPCENCKFNISNALEKITYCGEQCSIIFPCLEDDKYKFTYTDYDLEKFQMAQQILMNVCIPEDVYYGLSRDPESIFNTMYAYATTNDLVLKMFCPFTGRFDFHTVRGDYKTDNSKIDGQPDCFRKFPLPYYVLFTRNIGYKMGQYVYVASQHIRHRKIFTQFSRISDYITGDLWIYPDNKCEVNGAGTLVKVRYLMRLCNHRFRKRSTRISWWKASYNHRKKVLLMA